MAKICAIIEGGKVTGLAAEPKASLAARYPSAAIEETGLYEIPSGFVPGEWKMNGATPEVDAAAAATAATAKATKASDRAAAIARLRASADQDTKDILTILGI